MSIFEPKGSDNLMEKANKVFIATSLDGFIADKNGGLDWLDYLPDQDTVDMGYDKFISEIDALVMGRNTFEKVLSFGIDWPYQKPVFLLSETITNIPVELRDKVFLLKGEVRSILKSIHDQGFHRLYIDGGKVIQSFLREDLIDEMIITIIPTLLGTGIPLFSDLSERLNFKCTNSRVFLNAIVQLDLRRL